MTHAIRRIAPAKLNLFLHVTGRRDDGYHLLQSLFVFTDFGDVLDFERTSDDRVDLQVTGPFADDLRALGGDGDDNLVLRAASRLRSALNIQAGARIVLDKRLPVAAGIGGGSSDAAAALSGLMALWGASVAEPQLHELALGLGADVPACLSARPQWVEGVGDRLQPFSGMPPLWCVLANPGKALGTAQVFGRFAAQQTSYSEHIFPPELPPSSLLSWLSSHTRNDLEPAAQAFVNEIVPLVAACQRSNDCLFVRMSGSGPTLFAFFATQAAARVQAEALRAAFEEFWIVSAKLLV